MVRDSDTHGGEEIDRRLADGWKGCSQRISRRRRLAATPAATPGPMAPHGERAFNGFCRARIVAFTAGSHGLVHTYELSIPILLTVWVGEFSTTAAVLGLVVTVGYGLFGVGALPGGILVDRFGSKPLILACLGGMAGSFLLVSLAPNLLTLALAIAVWGSLRASITRRGCRCSRSRSISAGLRSATTGSGNLGIALGPLATALLLLAFDWRIVTAALTVPAAVVAAYGLTVDIDDALPDTENAVSDGDIDGDGGAARTERPRCRRSPTTRACCSPAAS